jgi:metal-responsive CopG/Arc/MetJ family transcriptional regulator
MDVSISLSESLLRAIDETRGDIPRSRWLQRLARSELERQKNKKGGNEEKG